MRRERRWLDVDVEFLLKEPESEFDEPELEVRRSRVDANMVCAYYPSKEPNRLTVELDNGQLMCIVGDMNRGRVWFEQDKAKYE